MSTSQLKQSCAARSTRIQPLLVSLTTGRSYYLRREYAQAADAFFRVVKLDSLFARAVIQLGQ